MKAYDNIQKIATCQGYDNTTGCARFFLKTWYDIITIQSINFTRNLSGVENRVMFFIIEETDLDFSQGTVKVLRIYFTLI